MTDSLQDKLAFANIADGGAETKDIVLHVLMKIILVADIGQWKGRAHS